MHRPCKPINEMLKSNGESTLPRGILESSHVSARSEPILTCENVPCTNVQSSPHAPMGSVERFEDVHERNESVGGRPHVQHVYQRTSHHVCTPSETALALVQLRLDAKRNSGMDHMFQHFEAT